MENNYPIVLAFYIDRSLITESREAFELYCESVNQIIKAKDANMMAFFIPTDGMERLECINPQTAPVEELDRINKIINDISKSFDIGQGADDFKNEK